MSLTRFFSFSRVRCRVAFSSAAAAILATGCTTVDNPPPENPRDYAFIKYWPQPEGTKKLRVAVKDLIDMKGVVTTAGSEHYGKTHPPAAQDAPLMRTVRRPDVVIVGKTNVTELALGVSGVNEFYGTPKSPLKPRSRLIPGGSSSGSAVAVATDLADVAIGTDTAGSIRVPAACCGVFGLKTTFGLIPLKGVAPISPRHLDTVGPLAKDVPRLAQGMELLQPGFTAKYRAAIAAKPTGSRIKVARLYVPGTDPAVDRAVDDALSAAGFQILKVDPSFDEHWKRAQADGRSLAVADAYATNADHMTMPGISPVTKAIIRLGEIEYKQNYAELIRRKAAWQRALDRFFRRVDFIALPTLQGPPPKIPLFGWSALFEARVIAMQNTAAVNFAGNPAIAVPVPLRNKDVKVTSVQLVGPRFSEAQLVNAARILAQQTNYTAVRKIE